MIIQQYIIHLKYYIHRNIKIKMRSRLTILNPMILAFGLYLCGLHLVNAGEYDETFMNTWLESTDSITVGPSSSDDWLARFSVYVDADEEGSYVAGCRQWCAGSEHCIAFFLYTNTGQCWIYDLQVTSTPVGASSYYSGARTLGQWVDYTPGSWVCFGTDKAAVPESVMFDFYLNIHINIRLL